MKNLSALFEDTSVCPNGEDEKFCSTDYCLEDEFACHSEIDNSESRRPKCIQLDQVCNGNNDCTKGEDEDPEMCEHDKELVVIEFCKNF